MKKSYFKVALISYAKLLVGSFLSIIITFAILMMSNSLIGMPDSSKTLEAIVLAFIQILSGLLYFSFLYSPLRDLGDKDYNRVAIKEIEYDKYKGLKIGFLISIIYFALALALVFTNNKDYSRLFGFINIQFFPVIEYLMPKTISGEELLINDSLIRKLLCLPLGFSYPIVGHIAYTLGYKRIEVLNKIIYKNTK